MKNTQQDKNKRVLLLLYQQTSDQTLIKFQDAQRQKYQKYGYDIKECEYKKVSNIGFLDRLFNRSLRKGLHWLKQAKEPILVVGHHGGIVNRKVLKGENVAKTLLKSGLQKESEHLLHIRYCACKGHNTKEQHPQKHSYTEKDTEAYHFVKTLAENTSNFMVDAMSENRGMRAKPHNKVIDKIQLHQHDTKVSKAKIAFLEHLKDPEFTPGSIRQEPFYDTILEDIVEQRAVHGLKKVMHQIDSLIHREQLNIERDQQWLTYYNSDIGDSFARLPDSKEADVAEVHPSHHLNAEGNLEYSTYFMVAKNDTTSESNIEMTRDPKAIQSFIRTHGKHNGSSFVNPEGAQLVDQAGKSRTDQKASTSKFEGLGIPPSAKPQPKTMSQEITRSRINAKPQPKTMPKEESRSKASNNSKLLRSKFRL